MGAPEFVPQDECDDCATGDGDPCDFHEGVIHGSLSADHLWRLLVEQVLPTDKSATLLAAHRQLADAQEFYGSEVADWPGFAALVTATRDRLHP